MVKHTTLRVTQSLDISLNPPKLTDVDYNTLALFINI